MSVEEGKEEKGHKRGSRRVVTAENDGDDKSGNNKWEVGDAASESAVPRDEREREEGAESQTRS